MTATYGRLVHGNARWGIAAQPHVLIKLKRLFPRVDQNRAGHVILADTAEVARDLEWFTQRYPLDMEGPVAGYLQARADEHRSTEQVVRDILSGHVRPTIWREPARSPRPYQQQAADVVHATGRLLLADELGLGKTFSALQVLRAPEALPALIVTPTHLTRQWMDELEKSLPWLHGHVAQTSRPYDPAKRRGSGGRVPDVLIVTYSKLAGWADHLATPVFNYGDEIHNIMQILAPDALGTREEFVREWGGGERGIGRHVAVADPAALGTYLRDQGLLLRRSRKDVGRELAEPVRLTQAVDTDHTTIDEVAGDVAAMAELLLAEDSTPTERMTAAGQIDWRMRHATGVAKAPYVAEFVRLLLESEAPTRSTTAGTSRDNGAAGFCAAPPPLPSAPPLPGVGTTSTCSPGRSSSAGIWLDLSAIGTSCCPWPGVRALVSWDGASSVPRRRSTAAIRPTTIRAWSAEMVGTLGSAATRVVAMSAADRTVPTGTSRVTASTATRSPAVKNNHPVSVPATTISNRPPSTRPRRTDRGKDRKGGEPSTAAGPDRGPFVSGAWVVIGHLRC